MSRVTVVDVLDAGACIDGVLQFIAANGMRIECDSGEFDEPYIQAAKLNGDGDGYGNGYGNALPWLATEKDREGTDAK